MPLLPHHERMLTAESGISPDVITARGYFSTESKAELRRRGFPDSQQLTPTLVIPIWSGLTGDVALLHHRPDQPRIRDGKAAKYEFPAGSRMAVDVHPTLKGKIRDPSVPLFITEGVKKADAAISQGLCCIALVGVWNWRGTNEWGGKTALPDWEAIALKDAAGKGRPVYIAFDSDVMQKREVYAALCRLSTFLKSRGASVAFVYLPSGDGGAKVGLDDFLAGGHSVDDLLALATPVLREPPGDEKGPRDCPYHETPQGLTHRKATRDGEVEQPLTNFTARIVAEVVRDDGAETVRLFEIEAVCRGRRHRFTITAAAFFAMNWPGEQMGAGAMVYPGLGTKDHVRFAIQMLSGEPPARHVYGFTGWAEIEAGRFAYLHGGGAIGSPTPVEVSLPPALAGFLVPEPPQGEALVAAVRASLSLLDLLPDTAAFPLFATAYRSVLGSADFSTFLVGPSGAFKTELAALDQQHFGAGLDARHLPTAWSSTDNFLEGLAFSAKDALLTIDDFAPTGTAMDVQRLHGKADRVLRGQGNGAARGRMRADGTLRAVKPPRGLILGTGEDVPQGVSLRGRMCILEVAPGAVDPARLAACQRDAAEGLYAQAMAGYLAWLAPQYPRVRDGLHDEICHWRAQAAQSGLHQRTPEITANLAVGLRHFLRFAVFCGALDKAEARALWARGWAALGAAAQAQGKHQAASEPTLRYLELLSAAIASGKAHVAGEDGDAPDDRQRWGWRAVEVGTGEFRETRWQPQGERVGWVERADLYLQPDAAFQCVRRLGGESGDGITLGSKTLHKRLKERGLLASTEEGHGTLTVRRMIGGTRQTVLHLHADSLLSGKSAQSAQPTRTEQGGADFREDLERDGQFPWADCGSGEQKSTQKICPEVARPHLSEDGHGRNGQIGQISQGAYTPAVERELPVIEVEL